MVITPGGSITVTIPAEIDLTVRKRYTILTQVTAIANPSGVVCTGTDFNSFLAGNPNSAPTAAPTAFPTISPAPTPPLMESACVVEPEITCITLDIEGRPYLECDDVPDPTCRAECQANAIIYSQAVKRFGVPAFIEAQREVCRCIDD